LLNEVNDENIFKKYNIYLVMN